MSCGKISNTCGGSKKNSNCVDYEGQLKRSSLTQGCTNINDTTEELYTLVDWLYGNTAEIELTDNCMFSNGSYTSKEIAEKYGDEICKLKDITANADYNTIIENLDMKCLVTPCGKQISNITELLQAIIDKIC